MCVRVPLGAPVSSRLTLGQKNVGIANDNLGCRRYRVCVSGQSKCLNGSPCRGGGDAAYDDECNCAAESLFRYLPDTTERGPCPGVDGSTLYAYEGEIPLSGMGVSLFGTVSYCFVADTPKYFTLDVDTDMSASRSR